MRRSPKDSPVRKKILGWKDRWLDAPMTARNNPMARLLRLEALEERTLLSASPGDILATDTLGNATFAQSSTPNGSFFSPQQITAAYSDNNIYFGTAAGNGAGQTIAIVDAYNDPNIAGDLTAFDTQFGLPAPPSFMVVNQTGSTTDLPVTDPAGAAPNVNAWEFEESLDVEWAHAIAPGANIVLVEANSNSFSDLFTAVATAATMGSVVSMSWGDSSEFSGELSYDSTMTATGVTYLACSGDDGSPAWYPAYSPNVIAVGGTNLYVNSNDGSPPYSYGSETAWSDSGGGTSLYEPEPAYQEGVQSTGQRDGSRCFRRCEPKRLASGSTIRSDNTNGGGDWYGYGGTSLATPIWAGLIAIADQGRVAAGQTTLSGAAQTLPALYSLEASSPGDFHDITSGSNGGFSAGPGYDEVTGLGSPVANLLVPGLVADGTVGTATELTVAAQPPAAIRDRLRVWPDGGCRGRRRHHGSHLQRLGDDQPGQQPGRKHARRNLDRDRRRRGRHVLPI